MKRRVFVVSAVALLGASRGVPGCEFICNLPLGPHRSGNHQVAIRLSRATYQRSADVRIAVTLVNIGKTSMRVDTSVPIWEQCTLHIVGPKSGSSEFDKSLGAHRTAIVPPGARIMLAAAAPLSGWQNVPKSPGTYHICLSYDRVESNNVTFTIAPRVRSSRARGSAAVKAVQG